MPKERFRYKSVKALVLVIIAAIFMGAMTGGGYALFNTRFMEERGPEGFIQANVEILTDEEGNVIDLQDESVNFLVLGVDESEALTDVMMIVNYDIKGGKISVLEIPRDTYVGDDVVITGKINSVYGNPKKNEKRIDSIIRVVESKFKLEIDHYATITIEGFRDVIDALGGIDVEVGKDIVYENKVIIPAGTQHLDGKLSELYIRFRSGYVTGDIGRMEARKVFIKALIDRAFSMTTSEATAIAKKCFSKITTDLKLSEIMQYYKGFKTLKTSDIQFYRIPGDGIPADYNGYAIYAVDVKEFADVLNEHFRPYSKEVPAKDLALKDVNESKLWLTAQDAHSDRSNEPDDEDPVESGETSSSSTNSKPGLSSQKPYDPEDEYFNQYRSDGSSSVPSIFDEPDNPDWSD